MTNHQTTLYTTLAGVYDAMYRTFINYDDECAFYRGLLSQNKSKRVLEIGCGSGHLANRLMADFDYVGMDISPDMLALARLNAPGATFIQGDMTDFRVSEPFDAILITARSISYLLNNTELLATFNHIYAALVDDGFLAFDFIEATSFFARLNPEQVLVHEATHESQSYLRESIYSPNLATGLTWNWASTYYQQQDNEKILIGNDLATLRAFLPDEVRLLLQQQGFTIEESIIKPSYAFDTCVFVARKK